MNEQEAKTKWCPFTRFHKGLDNDVYCNKPIGVVESPDITFCITSDCMMWRSMPPPNVTIDGEVFVQKSDLNREHGYCGLADKPQGG